MASVFTTAAKNAALNGMTINNVSLHTADPGTTGTSEVTGGTYARQAPTFAAAASSERALSGALVFNLQTGDAITHVGLWNSAAFMTSTPLGATETFNNAGTMTLTTTNTKLTATSI